MYNKHKWLKTAQHLQSIAQAGLTYTKDKYDLERFQQIMQLSKDIISEYSNIKMEKINDIFDQEKGYLTPKVDVRAVIFKNEKILLVKESSDGKWALPGGWADIGLTASEVVVKEVKEEAGIDVIPEKLLAVLDKKCHPHPPDIYYVYKMFFLCKEVGGELKTGIETSEVGFYSMNELPDLSVGRNTKSQVELMFSLKKKPEPTLFD